jgi:MFS family permease
MTDDATPADAAPVKSLPRNVKVLGFASLLNDVASEMIFPLLPGFLVTLLGGNKFLLGVIEGLADSVASLLKLWSGGLSDRAGRRKGFVVYGYSMAALVRPLVGLIVAPWQLAAVRVTDRIGKGIRTAPRDALIADSCVPQQRGRAFGFHRAMDHLGAAIGPLLATTFLWFWPDRIRTLFLITLLPGLAVVALVVFGLKEAPATSSPRPRVHLTLAPFDRNFRLFLFSLVVFSLGNSSDAFLLYRAGELGVPTVLLPTLWCVFHVLKSLANVVFGHAVDRFGPKRFIVLGWFVYSLVYLAFAVATSAWQAWVIFLCYALFYGLTEPAEKTLVAALVGPDRKGLAFGWFNFSIGITTLPASLLFGALYQEFGPLAAFGTGAGLALLASVLVSVVRNPSSPVQPN